MFYTSSQIQFILGVQIELCYQEAFKMEIGEMHPYTAPFAHVSPKSIFIYFSITKSK